MNTIKWVIEFLWSRFELFIRRVIFPSSIFILLLFVVDYYYNDAIIVKSIVEFIKDNSNMVVIVSAIITILALNYMLKFLTQFAFDNFIKVDYNPLRCYGYFNIFTTECKQYIKLRDKVVKKLDDEGRINLEEIGAEENDYILYQIVNGILEEDTRRYATDAKEAGVMIVSISLALFWYSYLQMNWIWIITLIPLYLVGRFYIKAKFRSRAYRLYINYLLRE